jgi:hypothetical protein
MNSLSSLSSTFRAASLPFSWCNSLHKTVTIENRTLFRVAWLLLYTIWSSQSQLYFYLIATCFNCRYWPSSGQVIMTTYTHAYAIYEYQLRYGLCVAPFTWSWIRGSASDGYCCSHWIVATTGKITALAIVALPLSQGYCNCLHIHITNN